MPIRQHTLHWTSTDASGVCSTGVSVHLLVAFKNPVTALCSKSLIKVTFVNWMSAPPATFNEAPKVLSLENGASSLSQLTQAQRDRLTTGTHCRRDYLATQRAAQPTAEAGLFSQMYQALLVELMGSTTRELDCVSTAKLETDRASSRWHLIIHRCLEPLFRRHCTAISTCRSPQAARRY